MSLGKRIKQARKIAGKTQQEFAELIDSNESSVASWEQDRAEPDSETLSKISIVSGVDGNWLLSGIGEMLVQERFKQWLDKTKSLYSGVKEKSEEYQLRTKLRVAATIPAGIGEITDRTDWHEWLPLDFDPAKDVILEISKENGESMMPFLRIGDMAIITDSIKVAPGDIVAALWTKNAGAIKIYDEQNGNAILLSYNPMHTPIILPKGKVKMYYVKSIIKRRRK